MVPEEEPEPPAPEPAPDISPVAAQPDEPPESDDYFVGGLQSRARTEWGGLVEEEEEDGVETGPIFIPAGANLRAEDEDGPEDGEETPRRGPAIRDATPLSLTRQPEESVSDPSLSKAKSWIPAVVLLILALAALGVSLWIFFDQL